MPHWQRTHCLGLPAQDSPAIPGRKATGPAGVPACQGLPETVRAAGKVGRRAPRQAGPSCPEQQGRMKRPRPNAPSLPRGDPPCRALSPKEPTLPAGSQSGPRCRHPNGRCPLVSPRPPCNPADRPPSPGRLSSCPSNLLTPALTPISRPLTCSPASPARVSVQARRPRPRHTLGFALYYLTTENRFPV